MKTIHKFKLRIVDSQIIQMPCKAKILSVQMQDGVPCIWALVDPIYDPIDRMFYIYGTGHQIDASAELEFIGTVQRGPLVFHIFEVL